MPYQMMQVTSVNPNDVTGGGGCVCDPERQIDCKPPYVVFPGNDMENIASPHVVICQACLEAGVKLCGGEILAAGEPAKGPRVITGQLAIAVTPSGNTVVLTPVDPATKTPSGNTDDDEDLPEV